MRAFAVALLVLLAGCSTSPTDPSEATAVPSERVLKFAEKPDGEYATLVLRRDRGFAGGGCYLAVSVDGDRVAMLEPREQAVLYLPPGDYVVGTAAEGRGLCSLASDGRARDVTLRAGQVRTYRLFPDQNGNMDVVASPN